MFSINFALSKAIPLDTIAVSQRVELITLSITVIRVWVSIQNMGLIG